MDNKKQKISKELKSTQAKYHRLLNILSDNDLKRKSNNPGWTNGEVLFHMLLGFIVIVVLFPLVKVFIRLPKAYSKVFARILNSATPIFNVFNAVGARIGGKTFSTIALKEEFDHILTRLLKKLDTTKEKEWGQGMYFPDRWDSLFDEYMTLEKLFYYPIKHFNFHLKQIKK